jgi:hypothetical protein
MLNGNQVRKVALLALDYFKYTQTTMMILSLFMTAGLLFICLFQIVLPFILPYILNFLSSLDIKNGEYNFNLNGDDMLKIYGWLSFAFFIIGSILKRFTKFRIILSLRRKLFYAITFIVGSYIVSGIILISRVSKEDLKESYLVLIFFTVFTSIVTIYGITISHFLDKLRNMIATKRTTASVDPRDKFI